MTIHYKIAVTAGVITAALGVVGLTPLALSYAHSKTDSPLPATTAQQPALQAPKAPDTPVISGKPARLEVVAAGIDIAVIDGNYNATTQEWTLTNDKAQFALPSTEPNNQSGNTLIYGHNTNRVFAALRKLPVGTTAKVHTQNGHIFTYVLRTSETVAPTNTEIFDYQGAPRLTLQTCTGVWSEARQFFYFDLVSTE